MLCVFVFVFVFVCSNDNDDGNEPTDQLAYEGERDRCYNPLAHTPLHDYCHTLQSTVYGGHDDDGDDDDDDDIKVVDPLLDDYCYTVILMMMRTMMYTYVFYDHNYDTKGTASILLSILGIMKNMTQ